MNINVLDRFTDENDFLFSEGGYFVSAHYHSCERHRIQSESILLFIEPSCFISIDKAVNGESNRDKISKGDSSIS